ncbi:glutathione S-transferase zeta class-like isoform X2 [Iris pallida]|uniref:Glutathione S-transferase zeta class-like isoform X2 n=1 Tax=Iris pallida TaxID=29817 RepID=A0AAX6FYT3_IRIPA|nr:glutathione S-transferase zeta class-like isoform X2 [Iris pallida]KAJ6823610.1 glutathione S-transferase zeta class-like isoform X2 [Iris pallida]
MPHVLDYMGDKLTSDDKRAWSRHNVVRGITALEKLLKDSAGKYATGDEPLLADVFLAPQLFVAINRFQIDMSPYPTLARINEAYAELPAFQAALPGGQPDAPSSC